MTAVSAQRNFTSVVGARLNFIGAVGAPGDFTIALSARRDVIPGERDWEGDFLNGRAPPPAVSGGLGNKQPSHETATQCAVASSQPPADPGETETHYLGMVITQPGGFFLAELLLSRSPFFWTSGERHPSFSIRFLERMATAWK